MLADSDVVTVLVGAAMDVSSRAASAAAAAQGKDVSAASAEPALKVILSALWNLSAHCRKNKVNSTSLKITREVFKLSTVYIWFCGQLPSQGSRSLNQKVVAKSSDFCFV